MNRDGWLLALGLGLLCVGGLLVSLTWIDFERGPATSILNASITPEPIIPTRTPEVSGSATVTESTEGDLPIASPQVELPESSTATTSPSASEISTPGSAAPLGHTDNRDALWQGHPRWCAGVASGSILDYNVAPLNLGWYLNWRAEVDPPRPGGIDYAQMVRVKQGSLSQTEEEIATIAESQPGSLWLIGNEPDVRWQDNVTPETYARLYHQAYTAIKAVDPSASVAIGGITQPSALRMEYLERVIAFYQASFGQPPPMDAWHIHNFILREERDSWGVDIPPGFSVDRGVLYEVNDCDDLSYFRGQLIAFRRWMKENGYRGKPLIVSEYGIPMPEDYGFSAERVSEFLGGTFNFFLTARDPDLGYSLDEDRLVQRWCWYSLSAPDDYYPNGRLFDPSTYEISLVGQYWSGMVGDED